MKLQLLSPYIQSERQYPNRPFMGVAARVLGDEEQYPPAHSEFILRLTNDSPELIQFAKTASFTTLLGQRLDILQDAYEQVAASRSLGSLVGNKELQTLLPINIQGVGQVTGSETISKEVDLIYRENALLRLLEQLRLLETLSPEILVSYGRAFDRFTYDIEFVADDILGISEEALAENETLKDALPAVAPTLTQTQLIQRIQGDHPNPEIIEEDLATLVGAVLRPLHYLPEWKPVKALPGSVVASTAALYELFRTSNARVELAPQLATVISQYYKLKRPYHLGDPYIQELFIVGRRILAEWYQAHPPQQPIWETSPELAAAMKEQGESPPTVTPQTQPVPTQPAQPTQEATQQEPAPTQVPVSNGSAPQPPSQPQTETQPAQVPGTPTPQPTEQPAGTIDLREQPQEDQDRGESGEPQGKPIPPINLR